MTVYDVLGVGFGPSNIALAVALEELSSAQTEKPKALFIERQSSFSWHPDMLLQDSDMQISFLKDLATPRNPQSAYTFVNYVFEKGRLAEFVNLNSFTPSRLEFNDYLTWAADSFSDQVAYGERVIEVLPEISEGKVKLLRVISETSTGERQERLTKNLVVSPGGTPYIPECFQEAYKDERIFHSHHFLSRMKKHSDAERIAVIGGGQSAAEIFLDLSNDSSKKIDLISRSYALKPADSTPYVNRVFDSDSVNHMIDLTEKERQDFLDEFHYANYSCVDIDLIETIHRKMYEQSIGAKPKDRVLLRHAIENIQSTSAGIELTLNDLNKKQALIHRYDAIVFATGYRRLEHKNILKNLDEYFKEGRADRFYRLQTLDNFEPTIFTLGSNELTHGLSDTLLSLIAIRAGEVADLLLKDNVV